MGRSQPVRFELVDGAAVDQRDAAGGQRERAQLHRRTLRVLFGAQVFGGAAGGAGVAVSPLLAKEILGAGTFAGLAFAAITFGSASSSVPLSRLMARRGRRPGLVLGYVVALAGAVAAVIAAEMRSFPLLLLGMLLFGAGGASNMLSRYAGADLAEPARRARGIAVVVWATTLGAMAGPNVLGPSGRVAVSLGLPAMAGPYLLAAASFGGALTVLGLFLRPDPLVAAGALDADEGDVPRLSIRAQLATIGSSRAATIALVTMATAHAVMVSVMTMTPLHLRDHGGSLEVVGIVISLHIAGMYALAPVVGTIVDRAGHVRTAQASAVTLIGAAALAALAGHRHAVIAVALVLLGLAWSIATISGATLLTAAVGVRERASLQGVADGTMGMVAGIGGTVSGIVVGTIGYPVLSAVGAVIAIALFALLVRGNWTRGAAGSAEPLAQATVVTPDLTA